ncbi:MAG: carboxypeptidase-like regulatory domain-containing protein [Candidatus Bathyarchaeota archaeon]|nr:carboxypeptidase-like regulatory domain-containing protein [Candidatus Bathyarchaeota archaeon]
MNKRILATIAVTLFLTSSFMSIQQVTAHYTLGAQTPNGPAQPMGQKGLDTAPDLHANPGGWGTDPDATVVYALPGKNYEPLGVQQNYYSPDGAILTDTTGDIWFYINVSSPININWDEWSDPDGGGPAAADFQPHSKWFYIAIPPEFGVPEGWNGPDTEVWNSPTTENSGYGDASSVITSITNDYRYIQVGKFKESHMFTPGWWFVRVSAPAVEWPAGVNYPPNVTPWPGVGMTNSNWLYPAFRDPWYDRQVAPASFPTEVVGDQTQLWNSSGLYWVRVKGLTAPSIAGKYFFKAFWTSEYINGWYETYESIDPRNYPALVVKAEVDPAYIAGRVIYGAHTAYYYGLFYGEGVDVPGKVIAEGTTAEGRHVVGIGYFNTTADGYFEIEGLAPGTYTITAHALGMVPYTLPQDITVFAGQSKFLTISVQPAFKIATTVFSKCPSGPIEFPDYVTMTSYPENLFAPIYIQSDWPGWPYGYWAQYIYDENGAFVSNRESGLPDGMVPATKIVFPGFSTWNIATNRYDFTTFFGDESCYSGTPTMWDGHIPQWFATWTSGITPGTYSIETRVFGYVQTQTVQVVVPETEHPGGTIEVEMDIMKGGTVRAQVHFHDFDLPSPTVGPGPNKGNLFLQAEAFDSEGNIRAFNHTMAGAIANDQTNVNLTLIGLPAWHSGWGAGPYGMPEDTYTFKFFLDGFVQTEFPAHTISLCSNSSFSFNLVKGGQINVTIAARDSEDPSQPRDWLYGNVDGAGGGAPIIIWCCDKTGEPLIKFWPNQQVSGTDRVNQLLAGYGILPSDYWRWPILHGGGLDAGDYTVRAFTVGYVQWINPVVHVERGTHSIADTIIYLQEGGRIKLNVDFKFEMIPIGLLQDHNSYYFRTRAFDIDGNLAAANITAVQAKSPGPDGVWYTADDVPTIDWTFLLVGFSTWTTPMFRWSPADGGWLDSAFSVGNSWARHGYYDPTDLTVEFLDVNVIHEPYGIVPGTYTITIEEELTDGRYVQLEEIEVVVTSSGTVERTFEVDQAPLLGGSVYTRNLMMDFRNASWIPATISGSPDVGTYTYDGVYWTYYPLPGSQMVTVGLPSDSGYVGQSKEVATVWGATNTGNNFWLEESGIPIPEFPVAIFALISALGASLFLIRWRRETIVSVR